MSMNGEYLRLRPDELARALRDPEWLDELLESVYEGEAEDAETRHAESGQAWAAIGFLLTRRGFPVDIVHGEADLPHDDWGYGPPRYLAPDRVRLAADALATVSFDDLVRGLEPSAFQEADIYPFGGGMEDAFPFVQEWFEPLVPFFRDAADAGDALVVWVS